MKFLFAQKYQKHVVHQTICSFWRYNPQSLFREIILFLLLLWKIEQKKCVLVTVMSIWLELMTGPLVCRKELNICERRNETFTCCKNADTTVIFQIDVKLRFIYSPILLYFGCQRRQRSRQRSRSSFASQNLFHHKQKYKQSPSPESPHTTLKHRMDKRALFFSFKFSELLRLHSPPSLPLFW